jgi:GNAT superfamily N-acetyltransferase
VGVLGLAPPGTCQPPPHRAARLLPATLRAGPLGTIRTLCWFFQWERRDPAEPHWHLGPVAVKPELQGQSIGSCMMERFVEIVDSEGGAAYLETDKPENVSFYEKFGFEIVEKAVILNTPNWFMSRTTRTEGAG